MTKITVLCLLSISMSLKITAQNLNQFADNPPSIYKNTSYTAKPAGQISIGDIVPNIELKNIVNYKTTKARLSDFKGKALILDFWAPWCSPCLSAFPKLDSFAAQFEDRLKIIPITKESKEYSTKVLSLLKQKYGLTQIMSVVEDSTVSRLFKHKIIPHYIWIDSNQIIRAITGTDELTQQNIEKFLDGDLLDVTEKKDKLNYNDQKPYFASGQLDIRDKLLYQSTMTGFIQDAPGGSIRRKNWINCSNHSILHLYKIAFGEFNTDYFNNNRIVLEGFTSRQDSIQIGRLYADPDWKTSFRNYVYCYEIVVPDSLYTTKQMFKLMQQDINKYFSALGLNGRMEKKPIKVLSLIRTSNIDKIKTKGGKQKNEHNDAFINFQNMPIGFITINLQSFYAAEGSLPIINETNYLENIDLKIEANLSDIEAVNKELIRYDLKLIEKEKTMDVIIVRKLSDSNKTSNIPNSSTN